MDQCAKCEGLYERFNIASPEEYKDVTRQLIGMVRRGSLAIVKASCPLEDILNPQWPDDIITHDFKCTACGRSFHLSADTYHDNASWESHDRPDSN